MQNLEKNRFFSEVLVGTKRRLDLLNLKFLSVTLAWFGISVATAHTKA